MTINFIKKTSGVFIKHSPEGSDKAFPRGAAATSVDAGNSEDENDSPSIGFVFTKPKGKRSKKSSRKKRSVRIKKKLHALRQSLSEIQKDTSTCKQKSETAPDNDASVPLLAENSLSSSSASITQEYGTGEISCEEGASSNSSGDFRQGTFDANPVTRLNVFRQTTKLSGSDLKKNLKKHFQSCRTKTCNSGQKGVLEVERNIEFQGTSQSSMYSIIKERMHAIFNSIERFWREIFRTLKSGSAGRSAVPYGPDSEDINNSEYPYAELNTNSISQEAASSRCCSSSSAGPAEIADILHPNFFEDDTSKECDISPSLEAEITAQVGGYFDITCLKEWDIETANWAVQTIKSIDEHPEFFCSQDECVEPKRTVVGTSTPQTADILEDKATQEENEIPPNAADAQTGDSADTFEQFLTLDFDKLESFAIEAVQNSCSTTELLSMDTNTMDFATLDFDQLEDFATLEAMSEPSNPEKYGESVVDEQNNDDSGEENIQETMTEVIQEASERIEFNEVRPSSDEAELKAHEAIKKEDENEDLIEPESEPCSAFDKLMSLFSEAKGSEIAERKDSSTPDESIDHLDLEAALIESGSVLNTPCSSPGTKDDTLPSETNDVADGAKDDCEALNVDFDKQQAPQKIVFRPYNPCTKTRKPWADYDSDDSDSSVFSYFFGEQRKKIEQKKKEKALLESTGEQASLERDVSSENKTSSPAIPQDTGNVQISTTDNSASRKFSSSGLSASDEINDADCDTDGPEKEFEDDIFDEVSGAEEQSSSGKQGCIDIGGSAEGEGSDVNQHCQLELTEQCRKEFSSQNSFWVKTELLVLQLEENKHLPEKQRSTKVKFAAEDNDSVDADESDGSADLIGQGKNENGPPNFKKLKDAETELKYLKRDGGKIITGGNSRRIVRALVQRYRRVFLNFIYVAIFQCNGDINKLIGRILSARRSIGEIISLGVAASNEISIIQEKLTEEGSSAVSYWKERLLACKYLQSELSVKFSSLQEDFELLESEVASESKRIVQNITHLVAVRELALAQYTKFYEANNSVKNFGKDDVHKITHVHEYKHKSTWHSHLNIDGFEELLANDMDMLAKSISSLAAMIKETDDTFQSVSEKIYVQPPALELDEEIENIGVCCMAQSSLSPSPSPSPEESKTSDEENNMVSVQTVECDIEMETKHQDSAEAEPPAADKKYKRRRPRNKPKKNKRRHK